MNTKEQTIKLIVKQVPKYVVIDPLSTRLDKNLIDNVYQIKSIE